MGMNTTRAHTMCTACGSADLLSVSIHMGDGPVSFWTCSLCEATGWEREGAGLPRNEALANIPRR
jgi:hypothetical protein